MLSALLRNLNLGDSDLLKVASGFPGGIGRMREACGALIGGAIAIGLAYSKGELKTGMVALEQPEEVETIIRTKRLAERFKEKFAGQLRCTEVQQVVRGADFKGYTRFTTADAFEDHAKCGDVVGPAARMAAEVILEPFEPFADEINAILGDLKEAREDKAKRKE